MNVTKKDLAALLGKSEKTLSEWTKEGMPVAAVGGRGKVNQYDVPKVIEWVIAREVEKALGEDGAVPVDGLTAQRKKYLEVKTAREEEKLKKERSEVIPADLVQLAWSDILGTIRRGCLDMPARLGPVLVNIANRREAEQIVKEEVYAVLESLAKEPEYAQQADTEAPEDDPDESDA